MAAQRILVVDDSLMLLRFTENILAKNFSNFQVETAKRATEGLQKFQISKPDLVLLDYTLPDMKGDEFCQRARTNPALAHMPIVMMCGNGVDVRKMKAENENIIQSISKPFTPELLVSTVTQALAAPKIEIKKTDLPVPAKPTAQRARVQLSSPTTNGIDIATSNIVFCGHTGSFSLRAALHTIQTDKLTGVLRVFTNRYPVELMASRGQIVFATTRDTTAYCLDSTTTLPPFEPNLLLVARKLQSETACPLFLFLANRNIIARNEAIELVREHGARLFARLWTELRVNVEFEEMTSLVDYARKFPAEEKGVDDWILRTLRFVKEEDVDALHAYEANGIPAYTRAGYDLVQKMPLRTSEVRFARLVNNDRCLQKIADELKIPISAACLEMFRFQTLEVMEYWPLSMFKGISA